jgi:hypothetical protein
MIFKHLRRLSNLTCLSGIVQEGFFPRKKPLGDGGFGRL